MKKTKPSSASYLSDTTAVIDWLAGLSEPEFRDKVLRDLFKALRSEKLVAWFDNIHGRNDKGVDYLVVEQTTFGRRIIGVQVKSREINRTGANGAYSSLDLKSECTAALQHEFLVEGTPSRLDLIEVWNSTHTTEDAERELSAPGLQIKIPLRKPLFIAELIERHCPDLIKNIPQYTIGVYIKSKKTPPNKAYKLLGCQLNPATHFLEPEFTIGSASYLNRIKKESGSLKKKHVSASVYDILEDPRHILIAGGELCGKTYLLEHLEFRFAEKSEVPLFLSAKEWQDKSASQLIEHAYKCVTGMGSSQANKKLGKFRINLLIDDFVILPDDLKRALLSGDSNPIRVIGTGRHFNSQDYPDVSLYTISGVKMESVSRLLRTIDTSHNLSAAATDRAVVFLKRVFSSSGLPRNPFTVAICLHECQHSKGRFGTPTFGRLIERFVEAQAGSHSDFEEVDFETKTDILKRLASKSQLSFKLDTFTRTINRYLVSWASPHRFENVLSDLLKSGLFHLDAASREVKWSHPVFKHYYWVRNLVEHKKHATITRLLTKEQNSTIAALAGSQLRNGGVLLDALCKELEKVQTERSQVEQKLLTEVAKTTDGLLPNDEQENEFLDDIEKIESRRLTKNVSPGGANAPETEGADGVGDADRHLSEEEKVRIKKGLESFCHAYYENRFHVAPNIAAVILNARSTKIRDKEKAVRTILASNARYGRVIMDALDKMLVDDKRGLMNSKWICLYFELQLTDSMLGDPYLEQTFRTLLGHVTNDDELLMLLDLILCCGESNYDRLLGKLKDMGRVEVSVAVYMRIAALYFYRYHRPDEKRSLRDLMSKIRLIHKEVTLPAVTSN